MERLYFIRVGGSAMGPVAAALANAGHRVAGSEEVVYEPMTSTLARSGVKVYRSFDPQNLRVENPDLVVVGNAVSRGHVELEEALNLRLRLASLPQIAAERLIGQCRSLVVTGTHGKTTTSSMTAFILQSAGLRPGWMIGGSPVCLPSACQPMPDGLFRSGEGLFVSEGDEYDTAFFDKRSKFLWLRPWAAALNGIEFDHADIFSSLEQIQASFRLFLRLIPQEGLLVHRHGDPGSEPILDEARCPMQSFGIEEGWWRAESLEEGENGLSFDLVSGGSLFARITLAVNGRHNVLNFCAAAALACFAGASAEQIASAAPEFRLPKRRMETLGGWKGALVIDDFAHHPTAVKATLQAALSRWPGRRIWTVFEPRTNTTTRRFFQKELEEAFEGASGVFLGPLDRPHRFRPEEKLDTALLVQGLEDRGIEAACLPESDSEDRQWGLKAARWLEERVRQDDVVLLLSNGDLGGLRALLVPPKSPESGH